MERKTYVFAHPGYTSRLLEPEYEFVTKCREQGWIPVFLIDNLWGAGYVDFGNTVESDELKLIGKLFDKQMTRYRMIGGYVILKNDPSKYSCNMDELYHLFKTINFCSIFDIHSLSRKRIKLDNTEYDKIVLVIDSESG